MQALKNIFWSQDIFHFNDILNQRVKIIHNSIAMMFQLYNTLDRFEPGSSALQADAMASSPRRQGACGEHWAPERNRQNECRRNVCRRNVC
jgi:hypothetical protein